MRNGKVMGVLSATARGERETGSVPCLHAARQPHGRRGPPRARQHGVANAPPIRATSGRRGGEEGGLPQKRTCSGTHFCSSSPCARHSYVHVSLDLKKTQPQGFLAPRVLEADADKQWRDYQERSGDEP